MAALTAFSESAFDWLVRSTLESSIIACLILVILTASRRPLPAKWGYALWLVLIVRMIMPWAPESSLSVFNVVPDTAGVGEAYGVLTRVTGLSVTPAVDSTPVQAVASEIPAGRAKVLPLLWLAGVVGVALLMVWNSLRLWWRVSAQPLLTDGSTLALLEACKRDMGVRTPVAVVETDYVATPALLGFIRPRVLLPKGLRAFIGAEGLRHVFLHELAHLKRHDIACNWLVSGLQAVHWFNPLIWYAFARLRGDRELACDALALRHAGADASRRYGETIVKLLERYAAERRPLGLASLVGVLETNTQLKRRITMIAQFKGTSLWASVLAALLVLAVSTVVLTDAVRAEGGNLPDYVPDTSHVDESGRIVDKLDYPFVVDPEVIGVWKSVDFVREIDSFVPGAKQWRGDLHLKEHVFMKDGYTPRSFWTWTKGLLFHSGDRTASAYTLQNMEGAAYMFLEWKSGDYITRHAKPQYYVLQKVTSDTSGYTADRAVDLDYRATLQDRVPRLDINTATLDDVIAIFGEPGQYVWGQENFTKDTLPDLYCASYPDRFLVVMRHGYIDEIRFHNPGYRHPTGLTVGMPVANAVEILGAPAETAVGGENRFLEGVLYRDINGRKGYGYYHRPDQGVRLFFLDDRIGALYLTRTEPMPE